MNLQVEPMENQVTTVVVEATPVASEIPVVEKVRVEEFKLDRDTVVNFGKKLIERGKIRSLVLKGRQGQTLSEIPLPVGVAGITFTTLLFPVATVAAALVVLSANFTLVIERKE